MSLRTLSNASLIYRWGVAIVLCGSLGCGSDRPTDSTTHVNHATAAPRSATTSNPNPVSDDSNAASTLDGTSPSDTHVMSSDPAHNETTSSPAAVTVQWHDTQSTGPISPVSQLVELADAAKDQWDAEAFQDQAAAQLARVRTLLAMSATPTTDDCMPLVTPTFDCDELVPTDLAAHGLQPGVTVATYSVQADVSDTALTHASTRGPARFAEQLARLQSKIPALSRYVAFKIVHVSTNDNGFATDVHCEASGFGSDTGRQHVATWQCEWIAATAAEDLPRINRIRLLDFATSQTDYADGLLFRDCTKSAIGGNDCYETQVVPGINDWLAVLPREFMGQFGHHGLAIGDVNQDGLDDLYVCDAGGLPNRLYIQQPDGTALEQAAASGVDFLDDSTGALLLDIDNDG
ncbi:MAG: VCBS repeat-containing protein, partial [Planctomycetales bacterium]|nr:VCBS repeat-containing protein [Planctomycetales bacterium]